MNGHSPTFIGVHMYYPASDFRLSDVEIERKDIDMLTFYFNTSSAREAFDFDGIWTPGMIMHSISDPDLAVTNVHWIAYIKQEGEYAPIGTIKLIVDPDSMSAEYSQLFVDPRLRNLGFGTRILLAATSYAFDILKLLNIYGLWKPSSESANRLHEKAKFPHLLNQNDGLMHSSITIGIWNAMRLTVKAEQKFDQMMDEVL